MIDEQHYRDGLARAKWHLWLIKSHLDSLEKILSDRSKPREITNHIIDISHAYLDIRLIIEEMMLLSVSAHETSGVSISSAIRKNWNAQKKMKQLENVNPNFFPLAIEVGPPDSEEYGASFRRVDYDFLGAEFTAEVYNRCGDILHASSSLKGTASGNELEFIAEQYRYAVKFLNLARNLFRCFQVDIDGHGFIVFGGLNFSGDGDFAIMLAKYDKPDS